MTGLVGLFLAGLALFFFGIAGIRSHLQQVTGRRFRRLLTRWTRNAGLAGAWGFVFGAITQSATAVAFILAGLIATGSLSLPRALMIVGWANVGTAVLVFLTAIDLEVAILYVVGVAGIGVSFDVSPRLKPVLAALFSIGLLFMGLNLIKVAFGPLPEFPWFLTLAEFARGSEVAAAAFGMVLRTVIQSSSAIAVLAVVLSHAGLLTDTQIVMLIFGATIGVTLSSFLLSADMRGVPRQIVLFHGGINGASGLLCLGLALLERATGWPLILSWIAAAPGSADTRLSFAYLFAMAGAAGVAALSARRAPGWLTRWSPPTVEQEWSQPQYLQHEALHDPDGALELVEREEEGLLARLPGYLEAARRRREGQSATPDPLVLHRSISVVAGAIREFGTGLADRHLSRSSSSRLLALERRLGLIESLNDSLHEFVQGAADQRADDRLETLTGNLIEAADTVLLTVVDCWQTRDPDDLATLSTLTEDRGDMMAQVRQATLAGDTGLDHHGKTGLFLLTSLFERIVWLLRQVGRSLNES